MLLLKFLNLKIGAKLSKAWNVQRTSLLGLKSTVESTEMKETRKNKFKSKHINGYFPSLAANHRPQQPFIVRLIGVFININKRRPFWMFCAPLLSSPQSRRMNARSSSAVSMPHGAPTQTWIDFPPSPHGGVFYGSIGQNSHWTIFIAIFLAIFATQYDSRSYPANIF